MLHITNGDSAAEVIRRAGVQGDVLPWRDVLHEGPVPQGLSLEELLGVRARFIAAAGWASFDDALARRMRGASGTVMPGSPRWDGRWSKAGQTG
jgi:hypothetical protein